MKFESEFKHFHSRKCIWKCRLRNGVHLSRPQYVKPPWMSNEDLGKPGITSIVKWPLISMYISDNVDLHSSSVHCTFDIWRSRFLVWFTKDAPLLVRKGVVWVSLWVNPHPPSYRISIVLYSIATYLKSIVLTLSQRLQLGLDVTVEKWTLTAVPCPQGIRLVVLPSNYLTQHQISL